MPWCAPVPRYCTRSRGPTIASALNTTAGRGDPGQRAQRLGDRVHLGLVLAGGAQPLPEERDRVQPQHLDPEVRQAQDDRRRTRASTSGLAQLRSHCQALNVVQTQPSRSSSQVKLPGAKSGNTSGSVRSYASGTVAVGEDVEVVAVLRVAGPGAHAPSRARAATWLRTRSMHQADAAGRAASSASSRRSSMVPRSGADRAVVRRRRSRRRCRPPAAAAAASGAGR